MFDLFSPQTRAFKNLHGWEFKNAYQNAGKAVLLDVRTAEEFSGGTIKGSKNLDIMSPVFNQAIGQLDKETDYFVFCRSGNRSAQACSIMAKRGLKAHNLAGGVGAWPL
jgi:rhodanese-related sulfurtransferase